MDDMMDGGSVACGHVFFVCVCFTVMDVGIWGGVIWSGVSVCPVLIFGVDDEESRLARGPVSPNQIYLVDVPIMR